MKKRKIALATVASLASTPLLALASGVITSCANKTPADDDGISVSTKDVEVNHNNGVGTFDVILDEQPVDNAAYVYIITAEGPHHVELLDDVDSLYKGHPAVLYGVENGIAHVNIAFTEFVGTSTKTVVGLEVRYNNRKGDWVLKHVNGINLTVNYVHNNVEELHIISLNDLHGVAEGYGEPKAYYPATNKKDPGVIRLMNKISPIIEDHPGSFLVTAGDNNAGDMFSSSVHGESIFNVLKAMGSRYSAVGNHAFEWGIEPMASYQFDNWGRTPETMGSYFISSNILNGKVQDKWVSIPGSDGFEDDYALWESQRVKWADPYKIVNMNGHLVCLIGLTTQGTIEDGNKTVVNNLSFIDYNAALNYSVYNMQQTVDKQLYDSIESFILLTHVESDMSNGQVTGKLVDLAQETNFTPLDAIISGHSHKVVNGSVANLWSSKKILIGQAETEGRRYLDLRLRFDNTKPVGQRKIDISQDVVDMTQTYGDGDKEFERAASDLKKERENPATPVVKNVIDVFDNQTGRVLNKLKDQVATREHALLYPASKVQGGIGHAYYINQRNRVEGKPTDGGYIFDQLGAWAGYSMLGGFAYQNYDDIEASSVGLAYPSVAMINQDSIKVELPEPSTQDERTVTLKDMFSIQTYENPTVFGYLSVFQLAKIIDHSLAGGNGIFNYDKPDRNYYFPGWTPTTNEESKTPWKDRNNLAYFPKSDNPQTIDDYIEICPENKFPHADEYKKLSPCYGVYPCGPVQMYGVKFVVVPAVDNQPGQYDSAGRMWKLRYYQNGDPETKEQYPILPNLYVLDPYYDDNTTPEKEKPYSTITDSSKWLSANDLLKSPRYKGMIPVVTNNFLTGGANWETPMEATYMKHNEDISWKEYPILNYSSITRDLMIEFCKRPTEIPFSEFFPFDLPIEGVVDTLVTYAAS